MTIESDDQPKPERSFALKTTSFKISAKSIRDELRVFCKLLILGRERVERVCRWGWACLQHDFFTFDTNECSFKRSLPIRTVPLPRGSKRGCKKKRHRGQPWRAPCHGLESTSPAGIVNSQKGQLFDFTRSSIQKQKASLCRLVKYY